MRSTQDVAGVGSGTEMAEVAQAIVEKMLSVRESLPRAANGQHIAPSSTKAAQIRKDMRQGVSREWARLLEVSCTDATDGVPLELVEGPYLIALAAIRHAAHLRPERPVLAISRNETRAETPLNLAQLRLAESPESIEALQAVVDAADRYVPHVHELRDACQSQLIVIRAKGVRTGAPRRGHIQLHA